MSSTLPLARLRTLLVAGSAVGVLTGCGAGFQPLTYEERNSSSATELEIGDLEIRNLAVEAPREFAHEAGETVEVTIAVTNTSAEADELVEVSTDAAASVELEQEGREVSAIEVPAEGTLMEEATIMLVDTTRPLRAGEYVELTLRFANNGFETVLVPVRSPEGTPEREHSEVVHGEEH